MNFSIYKDGKEIICDVVLTFHDDGNNIDYVIYTDDTKDETGELEIYASRYELKDNNYILSSIKNDYEWNLIDNVLNSEIEGL